MDERFIPTAGLRLLSGERLVFATRRHPLLLIAPLLLIVLTAVLATWSLCSGGAFGAGAACPQVILATSSLAAVPFLLDWLFTLFALTDQRLVRLWAPLWVRTRVLPLEEIASLSLQVGILGRLLGFGDLQIESSASRSGRMIFDGAPSPEQLHDLIATQVLLRSLR